MMRAPARLTALGVTIALGLRVCTGGTLFVERGALRGDQRLELREPRGEC